MRKELRMSNFTELPNKLKRLFKESTKRRMRKTRSVLRTKLSNSRRMLRRESRLFMRLERS